MSSLARTFFSLEGTATRSEWWIVSITVTVISAILFRVFLAADVGYALAAAMSEQPWVLSLAAAVLWLPSGPVTLRRLRDRQLPLWWLAVAFGWATLSPPAVRFADRADLELVGNMIQWGGLALSIFFIVQLGLLPAPVDPEEERDDYWDDEEDDDLTDAAAPPA